MLRGLGNETLTIYQKTDNNRKVPIWVWQTTTGQNWIYGQVPLSAVSAFQVSDRSFFFVWRAGGFYGGKGLGGWGTVGACKEY